VSHVKIFDWPDANREMPTRRWLQTAVPDAQHRYCTTTDGWINCVQDYTPEDYEEVMDIAEISSVLDLIVEFKASVEDSPTIAIFNGDEMSKRFVAYSSARREIPLHVERSTACRNGDVPRVGHGSAKDAGCLRESLWLD
jgi:hypothetical protein